MKKIWLSALAPAQEEVQGIVARLKTYGIEVKGHFWQDDLEKMAWMAPRHELLEPSVCLWAILASAEELAVESRRYGLAMLALAVQAVRGVRFPVLILEHGEGRIDAADLPTPLAGAEVLSCTDGVPAAKLVARVHRPVETVFPPYRLDVYGIPQVGQWLEVGPRDTIWKGAMVGVAGGAVDLHAVGTAGRLPEKSVLNYPQQGLKLELGGTAYEAWAVRNELDSETSYYVRVEGTPASVLFGPYPGEDDAEVFVVRLK
ncbi:hypothetical protein ACLG6S_06435 [Thermodesulfobacteriota bacterium B35]